MSRIVTRGLGARQQLVTRGYGTAVTTFILGVLRRISLIVRALQRTSRINP